MLTSEHIRYIAFGLNTGAAIEPAQAFLMAGDLERLAKDVEALEAIADTVAHHHGIPQQILRIAALLHRDGVSRGLPAQKLAGGAA